ncbi:MAG: heme biosynthesis HemY N-terminal domain-containing protein [Pseudomonadota bacterium]
MIRVIVFFVIVAALAVGAGWIADRPGDLALNWMGYVVEMDIMTALIIGLALLVLVVVIWSIVRAVLGSPKAVGNYMKGRKRDRGYRAISDGIIAVGAGDAELAEKSVAAARKLLPREPLTSLLEAQTAQLAGDRGKAIKAFEGMVGDDRTQMLGLHGLFLEAKRDQNAVAARQFAEQALAVKPTSRWAGTAMFEFQCAAGDWDGALKTLQMQIDTRVVDKATARRRRAVLLTALARDIEDREPKKALQLASEAHGLDQSLVPAAVIASRLASRVGNIKKATKVVEETWRKFPHPELAEAYGVARPGDSTKDRFKRIRSLAQKASSNPESKFAVAKAAIAAEEFGEARSTLLQLAKTKPSVRVCELMADLERSERNDAAKARAWLSEAVRAPRDPVWTADGVVSDEWLPTSPVSHRLDAFEWKVPVEQLASEPAALDESMIAMIEEKPDAKGPSSPSERAAALGHTPTAENTNEPAEKLAAEATKAEAEIEKPKVVESKPVADTPQKSEDPKADAAKATDVAEAVEEPVARRSSMF